MLKNYLKFIFLYLVSSISPIAQGQQIASSLLKEPADWEFERFNLPPAFAPGFPFKGVEELRFSPGMFQKDSADYFTYAFVVQLDSSSSISKDEKENYILNYYKGLCASTAKDRKLAVDTSKITVSISEKERIPANQIIYDAQANIFGVFADGAPVILNMEIKLLENAAAHKTFMLFIASPREKNHAVWKKLKQVQKDFAIPG